MLFKEKVIVVNEPKTREFFPEQFSNEIYLSQVENHESIIYKSNYGFKYVIRGQEDYIIDGKQFAVKEGQLLIMPADSEVKTLAFKGDGLSVFIDPLLINEIVSDVGVNELSYENKPLNPLAFYPLLTARASHLRHILNKLLRGIGTEAEIQLTPEFYYSLGEELVRNGVSIGKELKLIDRVHHSTRVEIYRRLELAYAYIQDLALEGFSLDSLAKEVGMSKYHLIKYFKQVYQTTPKQLQIRKRMETAKRWLSLRTNDSIDQIAQDLGYYDTAAFSNQYKRFMGESPSRSK